MGSRAGRKAVSSRATSSGRSSTRKWLASSPRPVASRAHGRHTASTSPYSRGSAPRALQSAEQRTLDPPLAAVGVVVLAVDRRPRAVVLADRLHDARIVEEPPVGGHQLRRVAIGLPAEPQRAHVQVEERVGIAGDQPLGQRSGLGEERPVPVDEGELRVGTRPHLARGHDVEHRDRADALGVIERHAVGDPATAVVAGDREAFMAERGHRLHLVGGQRALGMRGVIGGRHRPERRAVAGEIGGDDREALGQPRRHGVPHEVGLGIAVQQQQRRSTATDTSEDHTALGLQLVVGEVLEHGPLSSCSVRCGGTRSPGRWRRGSRWPRSWR